MTVTKNAIKLDLFEERMRKIMMFGLIINIKGISHSTQKTKKLRHIHEMVAFGNNQLRPIRMLKIMI